MNTSYEHINPVLGVRGLVESKGVDGITRAAIISEDGAFRYWLARRWGSKPEPMLFIMLNPSTADAMQDDPTIRRCIGFAKRHGFDAVEVVNLFAFRATMPDALVEPGREIIGPENAENIDNAVKNAGRVVCAWGAFAARHVDRGAYAVAVGNVLNACTKHGKPMHCLGVTQNGQPLHPLYLSSLTTVRPWDRPKL